MDNKSVKNSVISGLFWKFMERIGAQLISFIVMIVLARILAPEDFGAISLVVTFITLANVFVTSGFGNALIQKKDVDNVDFSTIFYFSIGMSLLLYCILFALAPIIANFYNMPILCSVIRVFSLKIPLAGINSVQQAYVSRKMLFKKFFWSTLIGTMVSAVIGIAMAIMGFGIWALVAQYLVNSFMDTIILWITVKWRPDFVFSKKRFIPLFKYGWKILASSLLYNLCNELSNLIIGKKYSASDLAYYTKGKQLPSLVVTNVNTSISSVLFPVLSIQQDNKNVILEFTRKSIKICSYIMVPILLGLFAVADSVIKLLLTDKWLFCVPYLRLYCLFYLLQPMQTANIEAIKAIGRSDLYLKLEVIKRSIAIIILLITMKYGVFAIAVGNVVASIIRSFINAYPNRKLLGYSYWMQIKDFIPSLLSSIFMMIIVMLIGTLNINSLLLLIIQVISGMIIYLLLSVIFKLESFYYIKNTCISFFYKNKV